MKTGILLLLLFPLALFAQEIAFPNGADGWEGDFTDYPFGEERFYELEWGWVALPTPLKAPQGFLENGLFLSGNNHSDDLFMFVRHKVEGLKPDTFYSVSIGVLIETAIPQGSIGIGGSPGEGVYFKVGASNQKPEKILLNGFYQLNLDKGEQSEGGVDAQVIGNLANPAVDPEDPQYLPKELSTVEPLVVRSNTQGEIWIFLGTDSGFEGVTTYYIALIALQIKENRDQI